MRNLELVPLARALLEAEGAEAPVLVGRWQRAAALLARQALEAAIEDLWQTKAPALSACSTRAQLLCLPSYLGDDHLADEVSWTWWALTQACHYHPYELVPTLSELETWLETVTSLRERVATLTVPHPTSPASTTPAASSTSSSTTTSTTTLASGSTPQPMSTTGELPAIRARRPTVLDAANTTHPERFQRPPSAPQDPEATWINRPEETPFADDTA